MRDHQHGAVGRAQRVHAVGHQFQRIDVEAGIGFIQNGELGLEHRHLQNFHALLLAAGEADIQRRASACPRGSSARPLFRARSFSTFMASSSRLAARAALRVQRGLQKVERGDAGNFHRILQARNMPLAARSSGASAVRSSPLIKHAAAA